jgi:signal transduction histidine kinase
MRRPSHIWLTFGICLALVALAVGWLSLRALHAERAELESRQQAQVEENVRLALWRMDSALSAFLAQENARPFEAYRSVMDSTDGDETGDADGERLSRLPSLRAQVDLGTPSSLDRAASVERDRAAPRSRGRLGIDAPNVIIAVARSITMPKPPQVRLYFQVLSDGTFTSPEIIGRTDPGDVPPAESARLSDEQALKQLKELRQLTSYKQLLPSLPIPIVSSDSIPIWSNGSVAVQFNNLPGIATNRQQTRNADEFRNRSQVLAQNSIIGNNFGNGSIGIRDVESRLPDSVMAPVVGILAPIVAGNELLLVRQVRDAGSVTIQGAWLDWPMMRNELRSQIADLLPGARFEIARFDSNHDDQGRRLALLPVRLDPGPPSADPSSGFSPVRLSLITAWGAMVLAAVAVAALLGGVMTLSERRGDFVSAVTHELRTPLTTFRMYAEMLSSGMVKDDSQRRQYLDTLRIEADRLTHLVENVLAYARLERGGLGNRIQTVTGKELLSAATQRLAERAAQADFEWMTCLDPDAAQARVLADPSAVEQILFNLVDNACKYGRAAGERVLQLSASITDKSFVVRLADRGPGFSIEQRRRLFQPFRKSAAAAAQSAPGVGLGLSLSRRLARDMGGDLQLDPSASGGATFELTLRRTR